MGISRLEDIKTTNANFKNELQTQRDAYHGTAIALRWAIQTALDENATMLDGLKNAYWSLRTTDELAIFDLRVDNAQTILNTLSDKGYNTTEAQGILDGIQAMRTDLEAALNAHDQTAVHAVNVRIYDQSVILRATVRALQVQVPQELRLRYWIEVGGRALNRTAVILSELEGLGLNVTKLQATQDQAVIDLGRAQQSYLAGDLTGTRSALSDLRLDLLSMREAYHDLILGGAVSGMEKTTVEHVVTALDDTTVGLAEGTAEAP